LVTFEHHGHRGIGWLAPGFVIDLDQVHKLYSSQHGGPVENPPVSLPRTMIDFLGLEEEVERYVRDLEEYVRSFFLGSPVELERQGIGHVLSHVRLLPPVPVPPKIVCLGLNYRDHAEEAHVPVPDRPVLFSKPSTAVVGPDDHIVYPKICSQLDYEVELAVVIGKKGKNISQAEAFSHIAGYTIFNDISARDIQFADKQWFRGKGFDTFAPTRPSLVLKDEVNDPHSLKMELRVNGEVRQRSTTANMVFRIPYLIAFISAAMTLQPGDIIATGTPAGVGFYAKPEKKLLKPGDVIEAEIQALGVLRNKVISEEL